MVWVSYLQLESELAVEGGASSGKAGIELVFSFLLNNCISFPRNTNLMLILPPPPPFPLPLPLPPLSLEDFLKQDLNQEAAADAVAKKVLQPHFAWLHNIYFLDHTINIGG